MREQNLNEQIEGRQKKGPVWLSVLSMILLGGAFVIAAWRIRNLGVLPFRWLVVLIADVAVLEVLLFLTRHRRVGRVVLVIIALLTAAICVVAFLVLGRVDRTLQKVTENQQGQVSEVAVITRTDSDIQTAADLKNRAVGFPEDMPETTFSDITDTLRNGGADGVTYTPYTTTAEAAEALLAEKEDAIILYAAYIDLLDEEVLEGFAEDIRYLQTTAVEEQQESTYLKKWTESSSGVTDESENSDAAETVDAKENEQSVLEKLAGSTVVPETYLIYISGIDTFGEVSAKSRSDVNILAAVNTKTHQICLVNTPRDYFVELPISNGVKDKLTHAGLYGIDVSAGALEMLYGVDIDQYVRVNFSGFEEIIDALGGIDVYSDYDFTVEPIKHYSVGVNHLSGIEALAFARERYAFADGDVQRGRNQMAVITAVINKLTSSAILSHFDEVLAGLSNSVQTSFTTKEIYALARDQLESGARWTVESYTVTGTGSSQTTYSIPGMAAYVMIPDETQVEEAKREIQEVLGLKLTE